MGSILKTIFEKILWSFRFQVTSWLKTYFAFIDEKIRPSKYSAKVVQGSLSNDADVAIIAAYPTTSEAYKASLHNQLLGIQEVGAQAVYVSNRPIPSEIKTLFEGKNAVLLERENRGRDFGAYKAGLTWLWNNKDLKQLGSIFLMNDTLYFFESPRKILSHMKQKPWGCLYLNLESHSHAQSFLLSFSKDVWTNARFQRFWKRYIPSSIRRHAIHKGEVKLTSELLKAGFYASPYINDLLLRAKELISDENVSEIFGRLNLPPAKLIGSNSFPFSSRHDNQKRGRHFDKPEKIFQTPCLTLEDLMPFLYSDPPHRIGLHLTAAFRAPMKKDMYKFYSTAEIESALVNEPPKVKDSIIQEQLSRLQTLMSGDPYIKYLRNTGEI
jgi:hypothetical protein